MSGLFIENIPLCEGPAKGRLALVKRNHKEIFFLIRLYAVEVASTAVFLAFVYVVARYEIAHLLAK